MKMVKQLVTSFIFLFVFFANSGFTQTSNAYTFSVVEGTVVVTPAWCRVNPCVSTVATFTGNFSAQISTAGDHILFPSSNLVTTPDVYFQLPADPNEDSYGTVREIAFTFEGNTIKAKGYVDSRAFDGPLVEYQFVARTTASEVFTARPDYRKCAAPLCGGYFVKLVNKKLTQCADGSLKEECYVASVVYGDGPINGGVISVGNKTPFLLVGAILPKADTTSGVLGVFLAKDAYRSATQNTAVGNFYGVTNNGIMCITTPCFSYNEELLNTDNRITKLSEVNLEMSGASPDNILWAQQLLANGATLYTAGKNQKYQGFAGIGVRLVAQQFYLPVKPTRVEK
ncbi:MAG: hypothetical protein B0W54_23280 [Cellvibrio sp. 79]|nr:MAG: hypothetical protein B0W54_23280 [Cellvibrio sp. 79]